MDVALTNSIVSTATNLASAKTSDALNMVVLKKKRWTCRPCRPPPCWMPCSSPCPSPSWPPAARWGPTSTPSPEGLSPPLSALAPQRKRAGESPSTPTPSRTSSTASGSPRNSCRASNEAPAAL